MTDQAMHASPPSAELDDRGAGVGARARSLGPTTIALLLWAGLIALAAQRGAAMRDVINLQAAPLIAGVDPQWWPAAPVLLLVGTALAILVVQAGARLGWRRVLVVATLVALAWGLALGMSRGTSRLATGLEGPYEYPAVVDRVDEIGVGQFVRTFSDPAVLGPYPVHVEGHPVGAALVFVALDRVGLGGAEGAAGVMILLGVTTVPAVLLAVREVAGEQRARQAAPFIALSPALIWMVTSADAMFTAVAAWAIAQVVLATGSTGSPRVRRLLAVGGGLTFGIGLHLSYGLAPLLMVPTLVAVFRRRFDVLAWAAAGGVLVFGVFAAAGFWWFDGLAATRVRYQVGVARLRPFGYFAPLGNPAAFAIATGPAIAVALARVRDRGLWLLGGGALLTVAAADLSGLSKGEIERIWLPFVPWVTLLAAGLSRPAAGRSTPAPATGPASATPLPAPSPTPGRPRLVDRLGWSRLASLVLGLQVLVAVVVETSILTPW